MKQFIKWAAMLAYSDFAFHVTIYAFYKAARIQADPRAFASAREDIAYDLFYGTMETTIACLLIISAYAVSKKLVNTGSQPAL